MEENEKKMDEKERRIRSLTGIYYSKPEVIALLLKFSKDRETVPRYFEGFGKRPDTLQYSSDIMGLVKRGATSFHVSEEIWENPLEINSEMSQKELSSMRKGWDLLIDIDSKFLDCSKIAAKLIIKTLENHGIKNYGLKFSGSRGFHIILPWKAFPKEFLGQETREMFPEWPRAISEYLINSIRREYNLAVSDMGLDLDALEKRTKIKKEDILETVCPECGRSAKKGKIVKFFCPECKSEIERKDPKITKRRLKCLNPECAGVLEIVSEKEYFYCEYCESSSWNKLGEIGRNKTVQNSQTEKFVDGFEESLSGAAFADLDLVLVAPRHLFRAPYSLHEKTGLVSTVLEKNELENFNPAEANALKVKFKEFYPESKEGEAILLLSSALKWKEETGKQDEFLEEKKYGDKGKFKGKKFESGDFKIDTSKITESMYPNPIKKLLLGIGEGRKRGLFILVTFFRSLGYDGEQINKKIKEWNEKNEIPLKEGYVRSQIDWHLKQKKQILPPNYNNDSFYKDLGLLNGKEKEKNPIVEVMRKVRRID